MKCPIGCWHYISSITLCPSIVLGMRGMELKIDYGYPLLGLIVWAQCDSNAWPLGYEPSALTWLSYGPPCKFCTDVCSENYTGLIYVGYAANRARTCDIMVNSHALYQLSYSGALWNCTNNVLGFKCFDPQTRWCAKSNT